ncbi:arginase family protein [Rudaea sp.]|uniref:arginase family protein n=1 Tax=Rudaea sp. TaxID=2136325 RepID=UPI00322076AD
MNARPVILDFDRSVGELPDALTIDLADWQEAIRFGCSNRTMEALARKLDAELPRDYGTVFMGSGDFHHLSWPLIRRLRDRGPFQVVVLDNHPDNMRFPFGIHCGSWVRRVAALPFVSHVHVLGITSHDVGAAHAWENYLRPLYAGKLTNWCMDVDTRWAARIGLGRAFKVFATPDALIESFLAALGPSPQPTYLTIDKDALSPETARTNWDQGRLLETHVNAVIDALAGRLVGSDINGEVSAYTYSTPWKRWLSRADGQAPVPADELATWQEQQRALNRRLLARIRH